MENNILKIYIRHDIGRTLKAASWLDVGVFGRRQSRVIDGDAEAVSGLMGDSGQMMVISDLSQFSEMVCFKEQVNTLNMPPSRI